MMGGLRVLVPLDDSPQAQRVLVYAQTLAAAPDGRLKLIRATDLDDEITFNSLTENAERLRDSGTAVESAIHHGVDAVSAIQSEVRTWRPDLIALASTKSSGLDRWLNGSVTKDVVRSTSVPVLVVPPNWEQPFGASRPVRILVPLDGSSFAELAVGLAIRLASVVQAYVILMRAIDGEEAREGVAAYLHQVCARIQPLVADGRVLSRVVVDSPKSAIVNTAQEMRVHAIVMAARPRIGSTGVGVFQNAAVPLVVVPAALAKTPSAQFRPGAHVRALDQQLVGEVHRIVLDLEQRAVNAVVVLTRGRLARDVLLPLEFVESVDKHEIQLRLTRQEVDELPDFAYNELTTAPPTWTSVAPAQQYKRLGPGQSDITRSTKIVALDGEIGHVESVESDHPETGTLNALWVRTDGTLGHTLRIPVDWVRHGAKDDTLRVAAKRADIEAFVG